MQGFSQGFPGVTNPAVPLPSAIPSSNSSTPAPQSQPTPAAASPQGGDAGANAINQLITNAQNKIASLQQQLQTAGSWGASQGQIQTLNAEVSDYGQQLQQLQTGLQNYNQALQAGVDPALLQQAVTQFGQGGNAVAQAIQNLTAQTAQQSQLNSQNQQLQTFDKNYQGQMFGTDASGNPLTMQQALSGNTGTIGALNQFETGQTANTFNQLLSPEIQMALGGQGLQNSGASVELQSRALANLQLQQQQSVMQAALGAQNQESALQQQAVMGNIAGQQGMVSNTLNTNNAYQTFAFQQQLMQQQAQLAQQLAQYGGSSNSGNTLGTVLGSVGAAASIAGAPFTGGATLAGLPSSIGMIAQGQGNQQGMQYGNAFGQAASPFFAGNTSYSNPFAGSSPAYSGTGSGLGLNLSTTPVMGGWQ